MFTGIITDTSQVLKTEKNAQGLALTLARPKTWTDLQIGESINTDGVCLTVETIKDTDYSCQLVPETLAKTTFGKEVPASVNLERSMRAGGRLGGHFVQGHVDTVGKVEALIKSGGEVRLTIALGSKYSNMVVDKGAVTINGVSLTVASCTNSNFSVALVPYTLSHTTLSNLEMGSLVNLEFDILGKYVNKIMESHANRSNR